MRKIRALVVDDNTTMVRLMSNCLEQIEDIEIVGTATGGRRALEQSAKLHPNLVLLDLQMPDMNGLETAAELRRSCPDARIIMVTTLDIPEMHGASLAAGAHAFLSKSRLPEELAPQLRELFH